MNAILRTYSTICEISVSQRNIYEKYYLVGSEARYQHYETTCCHIYVAEYDGIKILRNVCAFLGITRRNKSQDLTVVRSSNLTPT